MTLMNWRRPSQHCGDVEPVERDVAEAPFLDHEAGGGLAIANCRRCIELARTTIVSIAGDGFVGPDSPQCHVFPFSGRYSCAGILRHHLNVA